MSSITPEILQKISTRCSGHAMKIRIGNVDLETIRQAMGNVMHRTVDAQDPTVFDDKMPTIVTGVEKMSHTEFVCFVSAMDQLRFRDILIFPTLTWLMPEDEFETPFWNKMGTIMEQKFSTRTQDVTLEVE